jgi:hypothetical protein
MIDKINSFDFIGWRIRTKFTLNIQTFRILVCKALKIVERALQIRSSTA